MIYDMIYDIYDMIWYDMIWYDMIWYDMIWSVMDCGYSNTWQHLITQNNVKIKYGWRQWSGPKYIM